MVISIRSQSGLYRGLKRKWFTSFKNRTPNIPFVCEKAFTSIRSGKPLPQRGRSEDHNSDKDSETFFSLLSTPTTFQEKTNNAQYILNLEGKIIGIFKADSLSTNPPHEVAAYEICRTIGCRVVPKTKYAIFNKKTGSFQATTEFRVEKL